LIGFAFPNGESQAAVAKFKIRDVEGNQLGAAEGATKAEQKHGAIAQTFEVGVSLSHHGKDPFRGGWRFAGGGASSSSPNAPERGFDSLRVRWRLVPGKFVGITNSGQPAADRGDLGATICLGCQEGRNRPGLSAGVVSRLLELRRPVHAIYRPSLLSSAPRQLIEKICREGQRQAEDENESDCALGHSSSSNSPLFSMGEIGNGRS
jgi:hypothetical protein